MKSSVTSVLESALALPEPDRVVLAEALLASLADDPGDTDSETFRKELDRRSEEMKNNPNAGISWEELRKMT